MATAIRVGTLQRFREFNHRKTCKRLAEVCRVSFDHSKACSRLAVPCRVRFHLPKACRRLVEF